MQDIPQIKAVTSYKRFSAAARGLQDVDHLQQFLVCKIMHHKGTKGSAQGDLNCHTPALLSKGKQGPNGSNRSSVELIPG